MHLYSKKNVITFLCNILILISKVNAINFWNRKEENVHEVKANDNNFAANKYIQTIPLNKFQNHLEKNKEEYNKDFYISKKIDDETIGKIMVEQGFGKELIKEGFIYKNILALRNLETDDFSINLDENDQKNKAKPKAMNIGKAFCNSWIDTASALMGGMQNVLVPEYIYNKVNNEKTVTGENYRNHSTENLMKAQNTKMRIVTKRVVSSDIHFNICDPNYATSHGKFQVLFDLKTAKSKMSSQELLLINRNYQRDHFLLYFAYITKINPSRVFNFKAPVIPFVEEEFTNNDYILEEPSGTDTRYGFITVIEAGLIFYDFDNKNTYPVRFADGYGYMIRLENGEYRYLNIKSKLVIELFNYNCALSHYEWSKFDPICIKTIATEAQYMHVAGNIKEDTIGFITINTKQIIQFVKVYDNLVQKHKNMYQKIYGYVTDKIKTFKSQNVKEKNNDNEETSTDSEINTDEKDTTENVGPNVRKKTQNTQNKDSDDPSKEGISWGKIAIYIIFIGSASCLGICCYLWYVKKSVSI